MKTPIEANLSHLGVLQLRGVDSQTFLQGQLSADMRQLCPTQLLLAGYHSREGRVIAVARLVAPAPDLVLAVLPKELINQVAERLRKFVLRAKTTIVDASADWRLTGIIADAQPHGALPWPGARNRWLRVEQTSALPAAIDDDAIGAGSGKALQQFHAGDIADGIPQIYAATADRFVSQMLNLDVLGAIAFDKGCYTGQEIIARAHYRGKVKRRLQRLRATLPSSSLQPGTQGQLSDGRSFTVIDSVAEGDAGTQFLAVLPLESGDTGASEPPTLDRSAAAVAPSAGAQPLRAEVLGLPYSID